MHGVAWALYNTHFFGVGDGVKSHDGEVAYSFSKEHLARARSAQEEFQSFYR